METTFYDEEHAENTQRETNERTEFSFRILRQVEGAWRKENRKSCFVFFGVRSISLTRQSASLVAGGEWTQLNPVSCTHIRQTHTNSCVRFGKMGIFARRFNSLRPIRTPYYLMRIDYVDHYIDLIATKIEFSAICQPFVQQLFFVLLGHYS